MLVDDYFHIIKISKGNMDALEKLFIKYKNDVYRYAFILTKDTFLSEDITHDVFLKIVKSAYQYKNYRSVKAWIMQITRNTAFDIIKHNSFSESIGDEICNIESTYNELADFNYFTMLKDLSTTQREIVILHIAYGLKHNEIARILLKSPQAIRKQYQRALQTLKKYYV